MATFYQKLLSLVRYLEHVVVDLRQAVQQNTTRSGCEPRTTNGIHSPFHSLLKGYSKTLRNFLKPGGFLQGNQSTASDYHSKQVPLPGESGERTGD